MCPLYTRPQPAAGQPSIKTDTQVGGVDSGAFTDAGQGISEITRLALPIFFFFFCLYAMQAAGRSFRIPDRLDSVNQAGKLCVAPKMLLP